MVDITLEEGSVKGSDPLRTRDVVRRMLFISVRRFAGDNQNPTLLSCRDIIFLLVNLAMDLIFRDCVPHCSGDHGVLEVESNLNAQPSFVGLDIQFDLEQLPHQPGGKTCTITNC